jgi:hypothetical protein
MRLRRCRLALFLGVFILYAEDVSVTVRIKLIDGRTGRPVRNEKISLQDRSDYHDRSVRTNDLGVASLQIRKDAVILTHNTDHHVSCADERGGLVQNDFSVEKILADGIAQAILQPNLCGKVSAVPSRGELILFVRPWRPGEKI